MRQVSTPAFLNLFFFFFGDLTGSLLIFFVYGYADISDKELSAQRKARWNVAFNPDGESEPSTCSQGTCGGAEAQAVNRKATIVIERKYSLGLLINFSSLHNVPESIFLRILAMFGWIGFYYTDLIQASDVAHTMQHWHIFHKWNEKLFHEMYVAYLDGRLEKDPSDSWYQGEIGFYDFYSKYLQ